MALLLLGLVGPLGQPTDAFTAYAPTRSNIVESHLLLEPGTCITTDSSGEVETVVYRKIIQMKEDRIIPIF
jgi:hypothetical protein